MNRQAVNVLGALVVALIVVLGVLIGVLPRWQAASAAHSNRTSAAQQNQFEQLAIDGLRQQQSQLPQLTADVRALQQQIPEASALDQVISLAMRALPAGGTLQSIKPAAAQPASASPTDTPATGTDASAPATAAPDAGGLQQVPVTLTFGIKRPADAMSLLDGLRAGPRLLAVDSAQVSGAGGGAVSGGTAAGGGKGASAFTLTVAVRVFSYQDGTS